MLIRIPFYPNANVSYGGVDNSFSEWLNFRYMLVDFLWIDQLHTVITPLEQDGLLHLLYWVNDTAISSTYLLPTRGNGNSIYRITGAAAQFGIVVADMNNDGRLDLISVSDKLSACNSKVTIASQYQ